MLDHELGEIVRAEDQDYIGAIKYPSKEDRDAQAGTLAYKLRKAKRLLGRKESLVDVGKEVFGDGMIRRVNTKVHPLTLRKEASQGSSKITGLKKGSKLIILGAVENGYVKVLTPKQKVGYVSESYLKEYKV
jgi:hypothetical protein